MNVSEILEFCQKNDIRMRVDDGKLKLSDKKKRSTTKLIESIKVHKQDLISIISGNPILSTSDFSYSRMGESDFNALIQEHRSIQNLYIATPMQEGLLFHGLLDGSGASYTTQTFCDLAGTIDAEAFKRAWQHVVNRHDILRTCFVGLETSQIHQLVLSGARVPVEEEDIRSMDESDKALYLETLRVNDKARGFDFSRAPLMRIHLIRVADDRYHFIWSRHHILLDGWCGPLIFNDVFTCYQAFLDGVEPPLGPVVPYERYIEWLFHKDKEEACAFWKNHLEALTAPTQLALDGTNASDDQGGFQRTRLSIEESVSQALEALARTTHCTMNVIVQAAWAYVLHRYWGEQDVVFGTTVSGRPADIPGIEEMIGLFINTLPIRVRFTPGMNIEALLHQIHADNIQRDEAGYISLVDIHRQTELANDVPLFNSLMTFENYPVAELTEQKSRQSPGLQAQSVGIEEHSNYDLDLAVFHNNQLVIDLQYRNTNFSDDAIHRILGHIEHVLSDFAQHGASYPVDQVSLLSDQERSDVLIDWQGEPVNGQSKDSLVSLFGERVAEHPSNGALECQGEALTYSELDERSQRWAQHLMAGGLEHGDRVGVYLERGLSLGIALLAVWKAGGVAVMLDPHDPQRRTEQILEDAAVALLLTHSGTPDALSSSVARVVMDQTELAQGDDADVNRVSIGSQDPACLFYTSGSTGQPKGVLMSHGGLSSYALSMIEILETTSSDRVLQIASSGFDVILEELLPAWFSGAAVIMGPAEGLGDIEELHQTLKRERISCFEASFAQWREWLHWMLSVGEQPAASLRTVLVGCDPIPCHLMEKWLAFDVSVVHVFGLTETTVTSCTWHSRDWDGQVSGVVPMGRPVSNTTCYVLDSKGEPQPVGVAGELYIGGAGVALGYLNLPELTAERFVSDPFSEDPQARLYRTGDLARWKANGFLEFIGRSDDQVKVRGYRIELGEIESQLSHVPGVWESTVSAEVLSPGSDKQLIAYLVGGSDVTSEQGTDLIKACRSHLKTHLPSYMMPSYFIMLEALPLNANGKIDRKQLPRPSVDNVEMQSYIAPRTETEQTLCEIWASVLRLERVGTTDNFFEIGGDSILSIQVTSRAIKAGIGLTVRRLFEHQTIGELIPYLGDAASMQRISQEPATGEQILLPIHHWFFEEKTVNLDHNNQSVLLIPPQGFDEVFLKQWVTAIYARHDALRLSLTCEDGVWSSEYQALSEDQVEETIECIDIPERDHEVLGKELAQSGQRLQESLSLSEGRLFRVGYFKSPEASRLLLIIHHAVVDGVSWRILLDDLDLAYRQYAQGDAITLPEKTTFYQEWGRQLAEYADRTDYEQERAYWRDSLHRPVPPLPKDEVGPREANEKDSAVISLELDAEQTTALLQRCGQSYRTQINELLLTGLWLGIHRWTGQDSIRVWLEGHGREELDDGMDLSGTVGWFTTQFPLTLHAAEAGFERLIPAIKEQHRQLPSRGLGYGVLRYLLNDDTLEQVEFPQIAFNYLGQFDQTLNEETAFQAAGEYAGGSESEGEKQESVLSINAMVAGGQLQMHVSYSRADYQPDTVRGVAKRIKDALLEVIEHCLDDASGTYTPSDFSLASVDQDHLWEWQDRYPQIENLYPTVPMQEGMLFHSFLEEDSGYYVGQFEYTLTGPLETEHFKKAWQTLIDRHAVLRTVFVGLDEQQFHQLVLREAELPWFEEDLRDLDEAEQKRHLERFCRQDRSTDFDIAQAPMMRVSVIRLGDQRYRVLWTYFMGLFDGWSLPIINDELFSCYYAYCAGRSPTLPTLYPYHRYVEWLLNQERQDAQSFWANELAGIEAPTPLMIDRLPVVDGESGTRLAGLSLPQSVSEKLEVLVKNARVTMNTVMQLAWSYLLHRYSSEDDVVFGSTMSGRPAEVPGVEQMIGLFINTLPVRVRFGEDPEVVELLQTLHQSNSLRGDYGFLPLTEIQRLAEISHEAPLLQSILVFQNYPKEKQVGQSGGPVDGLADGLQIESAKGTEEAHFALTVNAYFDGALSADVCYRAEQFDDATIKRLVNHLEHILTGLAEAEPGTKVSTLPVVSPSERALLLDDWNATHSTHPTEDCVHDMIEAQVVRTPDAVAVEFQGDSITFGELNAEANQLAHYLVGVKVVPGDRIAIFAERSIDMVVGLLATMKIGATYVPLDISSPQERLDFMLRDSECCAVLGHSHLLSELPVEKQKVFPLDGDMRRQILNSYSEENPFEPGAKTRQQHPAYLIFTSGSTGKPKGVMVGHDSLANYVGHVLSHYVTPQVSSFVVSTPLAFDATVTTLWASLCAGICQIILPEESAIEELGQYLFDHPEPLLFKLTPAHLEAVLAGRDSSATSEAAHTLVIGGEQLTTLTLGPLAEKVSARTRFINEYGPTEATVGCSVYVVTAEDVQKGAVGGGYAVPIGRAIANTRLYVLDRLGNVQPIGVPGELHIGGAGLAQGYLNRPELTAEKFIIDPFSTDSSSADSQARLYRTGDLVRWLPDGNLEFLGRIDTQVKIRGYRIELGEIESVLGEAPDVREAVVLARTDEGYEPRLVAYVVPQIGTKDADTDSEKDMGDRSNRIGSWKEHLQTRLPGYMVPELYVELESLPLTSNGKVNRRALPEPEEGDLNRLEYVAPNTEVEAALCELWREVLRVEQVGMEDNFFALGGDSIMSIQLVSRAKQQGLHFSVRSLFEYQTVGLLAPHVNTESRAIEAEQGAVEGTLSLLPIQRRFFSQSMPVPSHYNQAVLLKSPDGLDESVLRTLIEMLYQRHDALRLRFHGTDNEVNAVHVPFTTKMVDETVAHYDLSDLVGPARKERLEALCDGLQASLDIESGPLFRACYFDCGTDGGRVLLTIHHLVVDGVSWRILLSDLELGWTQQQAGEPLQLGPKTSSLQQWGEAVAGYAKSEALAQEREYWLEQLSHPVDPLPLGSEAKSAIVRNYGFQLEEDETTLLLGECSKAYRTQVNELLLAALLHAYQRWSGNATMCLQIEGHGREELFDHLDTNETVGWYTSVYPLLLTVPEGADIGTLIKTVKEQYRALPNRGFGYGVLTEVCEDQELLKASQPLADRSIEFNYLGQFNDGNNAGNDGNSAFSAASESVGRSASEKNPFPIQISINGVVYENALSFSVETAIDGLAPGELGTEFQSALQLFIAHCREVNEQSEFQEKNQSIIADEDALQSQGIEI